MKIERLFNIIYILLNEKRVTAKSLAEKFEVSTRTIYRDIESLSMSGIPIYADKGYGGGISLLDHYVLNKTLMSEEERNSILLGLEVLESTHYLSEDKVLSKIKSLLNASQKSYIEIDFSGFGDNHSEKIFNNLKLSLKQSVAVNIVYRNSFGDISHRKINPLKLVFKKQNWYLIAYCYKREMCRTFKIARILKIALTTESYCRDDYDMSDVLLRSHDMKNMKHVTLVLEEDALMRVEEEMQLCQINLSNTGQITVEFETEVDEWFTNYIMSYADYLIDIKPSELKDRLRIKAQKIMKL